MWTIKPQTIYVMGGRMKVDFRGTHPGRHGSQHILDITLKDIACRVRFSAGGDVIRIEKLTPEVEGRK